MSGIPDDTTPAIHPRIRRKSHYNDAMNGETPEKKDKTLLYVLLAGGGCLVVFAIVAVIVFTVLFKVTSEPADVVNQYLSALRNGDVEKANSHCSKAFRQNTNLQGFRTFLNQNQLLMKATEFSTSNREIANGVANLKGTLKCADGSSVKAEFQLVQEGKAWKIQSIHLSPTGVSE